ncbi:MAG: hypothetical protein R2746_00910 [Acidimicrobiales bacterium]
MDAPTARVVDETTVEVDGRRYEVGEPGDLVVVEDWDCDGAESAGVLRPGTGEIFLFDRWPESGLRPWSPAPGFGARSSWRARRPGRRVEAPCGPRRWLVDPLPTGVGR